MSWPHPPRLLPIVALAALIVACGGGDSPAREPAGTGEPRTFALGLSSLPVELTDESYDQAFELAAAAGEVVLIQRPPPWEELLGGGISQETAVTAGREIDLAKKHGLDLFVAIDPIDIIEGQTQLAGAPPSLAGAGFANQDIRQAFSAYAQFVADNYRPKYLALGVEVNTYQGQHPQDFDAFLTLYQETYDAVKALSPDTQVFPTFRLEELRGLLPVGDPHPPQWSLIGQFEPRLDLLALSSYPGAAYTDPAELPGTYFTSARAYTDRPVIIAEMGFTSEPTRANAGATEAQQTGFLLRAINGAEQLDMPLIVWFVGQDPTFASDASREGLEHLGLKRSDGSAKETWVLWEAMANRPLVEDAQDPSTEGR